MLATVYNGVNCHVLLSTFYLSLFFGDWHCRDGVFVYDDLELELELLAGWLQKNCGWIAWATAGCWLDASLLLYALFLFTSCTHDNTSTEWNTISLSRLDYLHFLWKICSCVVYQCIFWSNIHYVYLYSASQALLDYFVVLHYYSSLGLCYCLYLMWLL